MAEAQEEMDSVKPEAIATRDLYNSFRAGEIKTGTGEEKSTPDSDDVPFLNLLGCRLRYQLTAPQTNKGNTHELPTTVHGCV